MLDDIDIVVNKISNIVKVPVFGINRTVNNNNIVNDRHDYTLEERLSTSNVNTRLMIYSGHDSTLVPLLVVLGIYEGKKSFIYIILYVYFINIFITFTFF